MTRFPLVAIRARHIDNDSPLGLFVWRIGFVLNSGEGAEEEVAGVSHDGGAAGRDSVLSLEKEEASEEVIDWGGRLEFGETGDEVGGEVGGFVLFLLVASVFSAE